MEFEVRTMSNGEEIVELIIADTREEAVNVAYVQNLAAIKDAETDKEAMLLLAGIDLVEVEENKTEED